MADAIAIIEAAGAGVGGAAALAALGWKPMIRRHDQRVTDDLFLHGATARAGQPAIAPAGDRLAAVESKLDGVATDVKAILAETKNNGGSTLRDQVDVVVTEQKRVAAAVEQIPKDEH